MRNVIGAALASASSVSFITSALAQGRDVTVKTADGKEIKITPNGSPNYSSPEDSSVASIISGGEIVDPSPSGTFHLPNGQTITLANGRLVGGSCAVSNRAWAVFALSPQSRGNSRTRPQTTTTRPQTTTTRPQTPITKPQTATTKQR
jgi:hypothetical protein